MTSTEKINECARIVLIDVRNGKCFHQAIFDVVRDQNLWSVDMIRVEYAYYQLFI